MGLKINNLTGGYTQFPVLNQVSFEVDDSEIIGLIGLNGAGKSTTIKHIIGLLEPFEGSVTVDGLSLRNNPQMYRKKIGYVPETPALYEELTLKEHIEITAMAYGIGEKEAWDRADELLSAFQLQDRLEWFPSYFSKGMKQKVMIVCAFLINPDLYVIDEPFLGLDPIAINTMLKRLEEKKKEGASILMSTHVLSTAERYCDRFVILHQGKAIAVGTLEQLQDQYDMPSSTLDDIYVVATSKEHVG
ncbi:ABC transporter ATP-binding protein [Atopococcus tabaci]|uniref:ABC transporter ATP-binding protein n=1 Tax=Atopococcus tabaci TaxID=269774 RepID=UPI0004075487|nr:ABC transporter ATP-binding protein [Atopococcus tabaci]